MRPDSVPLKLLYDYYTNVIPNRRVLELCGATEPSAPYTRERDPDLTVIINGYARPEYLPLIWEAVQYQTRRPRETWVVQNDTDGKCPTPRDFFQQVRNAYSTVVIDSGLNHGCWFRFFLAALYCRTRYVAIYDDDTLSGQRALEAALADMATRPGIYGARGITFRREVGGPCFWNHDVSGWPTGTPIATEVDFVGHMWVMETSWLNELLKYIPDRLFSAPNPARECGEDMYVSFAAQKRRIPTLVYGHGQECNPRWSSIQGYEMGFHPNSMNMSGGLSQGDLYLQDFIRAGWKLLRFS